jgi:hypothetical protein
MKAPGRKRGQLDTELSNVNLRLPLTESTTREYVLIVLTNQREM